jgi:hypothetical protein
VLEKHCVSVRARLGCAAIEQETLRWLGDGADGHAPALDYMGNQFRVGKTVPRITIVHSSSTIAAGMDNANAISNLLVYRDGTGPKDVARRSSSIAAPSSATVRTLPTEPAL